MNVAPRPTAFRLVGPSGDLAATCGASPGRECRARRSPPARRIDGMDEPPARGPAFAAATRYLHAAALARAVDEPDAADRIVPLLTGRLARRPHLVDRAIDAAIRAAAHDLLSRGWRPAEIDRFAAKRLDPLALAYLRDALAGTAPGAPPWLSELRDVSPAVWWSSARPYVEQWAQRHEADRVLTLRVVVDVLAILAGLPRTDDPLPGMPARPAVPGDVLAGDERAARRIDALLARAGDPAYPAEAAACARKAEQLLRPPGPASQLPVRPPGRPPIRPPGRPPGPLRIVRGLLHHGRPIHGLLNQVWHRSWGRRPVAALPAAAAAPPPAAAEREPAQVPNGRS